MLELTFWGVRGSFPITGPESSYYGGNTSCLQISSEHQLLIIDAGSGIIDLGQQLRASGIKQVDIFLSHMHWDHLQGLPFFEPLYDPDCLVRLYAPRHWAYSLAQGIADLQHSEFCERSFESIRARLEFVELVDGSQTQVGPLQITCRFINHPELGAGYRVDSNSGSLAYTCDAGSIDDVLLAAVPPELSSQQYLDTLRENLRLLAKGASALVYDGFFTPEQHQTFPHYAHSTGEDGVRLCQAADCRCLFVNHHHHSNSDQFLRERLETLGRLAASKEIAVHMATEGQTWIIEQGQVRLCK